MTSEEATALTREIAKLRQAIERNQRALMNGKDAALYLGYCGPLFRTLVAKGVIPQTKLMEDLEPRYARVVLDRIINECTKEKTDA